MVKKTAKTRFIPCFIYFYSPFAWILSHTLHFYCCLHLARSFLRLFAFLFLSNSLTLLILSLLFLSTLASLRLSYWTICIVCIHTWARCVFFRSHLIASQFHWMGVCVCVIFSLPFGAIKCGVSLAIQLWYLSDEWILKDWLLRVVFLPLCQLSATVVVPFHLLDFAVRILLKKLTHKIC